MNKNVDPAELKKFADLAVHWWDTEGELRTLHQINPLRLSYIQKKVNLSHKHVIDIGCGGGILSESMAAAGAIVTGIDMNKPVIDAAKLHLLESKLVVEYLAISAEDMADKRPAQYDVVTCLEMLEHVPDPASIVRACAKLVKQNGHVFFSTINRNPKSYLFAIIGAEYLLKLLAKNTHDYEKFIRPSELDTWCLAADLTCEEIIGINYNPFSKHFKLSNDIAVNYLLHAIRK